MLGDALFNLLGESLLLVGRDCSLVDLTSSAAAMLARASTFRVERGRIFAFSAVATARLRRTVLGLAWEGCQTAAMTIALPRSSDRPAALAVLSPLCPRALGITPKGAMVLIRVIEPEWRVAVSADSLRDLFGLTPAEARVALTIPDAANLREVAHRLHISLPTVCSHRQRIFEKTGTQRQSQLVQLLLAYGTQLPCLPIDSGVDSAGIQDALG